MKKKIISTLLAVATAFTTAVMPIAHADEDIIIGKPSDWHDIPSTFYVTSKEAHSDKMSLFIDGDSNRDMFYPVGTASGSDQYKITFYAKNANGDMSFNGVAWPWQIQLRYSINNGTVTHLNEGWTVTAEPDGWYKYESTYTVSTEDPNFHVVCQRTSEQAGHGVYIDDITLVKVGDETETNLIGNGGFEKYTALAPKVTAQKGDGQITVNWTNPAVDSTAVKLTVGDTTVDVSDANLTANATNTKTVTGLTNGTEYKVTVTNTTAYGVLTDSVNVTPVEKIVGKPTGWFDVPETYIVTSEESHSGKTSLFVDGNSGGDRLNMAQSIGKANGSDQYKITFYAKDVNGRSELLWPWNFQVRYSINNGTIGHLNDGWTVTPAENGWIKYEATFTASDQNPDFHIICNRESLGNGIYIDDITMVKVGDETETNLVKNGGFEEYTAFKTTVSATAGDEKINVTWKNPGVASSAVTLKVGDKTVDVSDANLAADATNTKTVTGLTNLRNYDVVVTNTTAYGDYSDKVTIMPRSYGKGPVASPWYQMGNAEFYAETADSTDGAACLVVKSGSEAGAQILQKVNATAGEEYTVSFDAKVVSGDSWRIRVELGGYKSWNLSNYNFADGSMWTRTELANGWYRYESKEYVPASEANMQFHVHIQNVDVPTTVYIDNIVVYKNSDDAKTNIVGNGSFESYTNVAVEAAANGYIDSTGTLYWTQTGSCDKYEIYKVNGTEKTYINETTGNYYELADGFSAGDVFLVKSVYGSLSTDGIAIKAGMNVYPYFATGTIDENGIITGTEISKIQAGNVLAGVKLATSDEDETAYDLYLALYNGKKLVSVSKLDKTIKDYDNLNGLQTVAATVNVPEIADGDDYKIGVMIWENDGFAPLWEKFELK